MKKTGFCAKAVLFFKKIFSYIYINKVIRIGPYHKTNATMLLSESRVWTSEKTFFKPQVNSFETCRTIGHQTGNANPWGNFWRRNKRGLTGGCPLRTTYSWHRGSMKLTNSAANTVQSCPDTRTHSKPTTLTVKTLNIAIEEGIFSGKDPNHEPSRNCLFCGCIAMVNIDLINFQEGKKMTKQHTHLSVRHYQNKQY